MYTLDTLGKLLAFLCQFPLSFDEQPFTALHSILIQPLVRNAFLNSSMKVMIIHPVLFLQLLQ
jgi:hypothetical protein